METVVPNDSGSTHLVETVVKNLFAMTPFNTVKTIGGLILAVALRSKASKRHDEHYTKIKK